MSRRFIELSNFFRCGIGGEIALLCDSYRGWGVEWGELCLADIKTAQKGF